jgi:hypothetical protein
MRTLIVLCGFVFAAVFSVAAPVSAHKIVCHKDCDHSMFRGEDVEVDFDEGSIVFTDQKSDETVEITDEYALLVNGRPVHLGRDERKLVEDYYDTFQSVIETGKALGVEGAHVGVQGLKLGLDAALGVLKLLDEDYDQKDLQAELDHKGGKIEHEAARLERKAHKLERKAERLQDLHEDLRDRVDELDDLGWF